MVFYNILCFESLVKLYNKQEISKITTENDNEKIKRIFNKVLDENENLEDYSKKGKISKTIETSNNIETCKKIVNLTEFMNRTLDLKTKIKVEKFNRIYNKDIDKYYDVKQPDNSQDYSSCYLYFDWNK